MNTKLIAIAAAFGIVFAFASASFAGDRPVPAPSGQLKTGKVKPSTPLRTAPQPSPETRGGTLENGNGEIIYF